MMLFSSYKFKAEVTNAEDDHMNNRNVMGGEKLCFSSKDKVMFFVFVGPNTLLR